MRPTAPWLLACMLLLCAGSAPLAAAQNRVALVVGNDSYQNVPSLKNARMDARAIARELERAGFTVNLRVDLNEKGMKEAIRTFKGQVAGGDVAVFYFSGHGVQLGGANYLLPVDIRSDSEDQVKDEAVPLQRVLDDLQEQKARFSLAIIDACRNNPFQHRGRALGGRGLAVTSAATGQMVLFSAGAGQQALDSLGPRDKSPNGLFTRVLLKEMDKPGIPVDKVLRNVRDEVVKLSQAAGQEQVPALYDQALGEFYFFPASGRSASEAPAPAPAPAASTLGAPPTPASLLGGLQVSANIPGAKIYVDGVLKGTASPTEALNLRDLPIGNVSVKAEADGYPPRTQVLEIREGQWTQAKLVLSRSGEAPAEASRTIWSKLNPATWIGSGSKGGAAPDGTALSEAAMKGDAAKVRTLLDAGANPSALDKWGWSPLHWAVYYSKAETLALLLDRGADPNLKAAKSYRNCKAGSTPLVVAAYFGYEGSIAALMKHRADPRLADADGKSALDYAVQFRFDTCAALLRKK